MQNKPSSLRARLSLGALFAGLSLFALACASSPASDAAPLSGSQLWAQNCNRCHNFRTPSDLSDSEWQAAMMHMRIVANLTAHEYTSIRDFLMASN